MRKLDPESVRSWVALGSIAAITGSLTLAFAWTAGWVGKRQTSQALVTEAVQPFPAGYRRAHGKGICFVGSFNPAGSATALTKARVFRQNNIPVLGRFSIGTGSPHASDLSTKTVSMALLIESDDGQQWRMAMNNQPFFATRNVEGFLAMQEATSPDANTGQPNAERLARFLEDYPEAKSFMTYSERMVPPSSFAEASFFGVNAFILLSTEGREQPVRWHMRPHLPQSNEGLAASSGKGENYLFDELHERLAGGDLSWDLVLQLAEPGDPVDDPSQQWPSDREEVVAGTLRVTRLVDQATGACRDVNFDPTIVPVGIRVSSDPILGARSGAYSHSFNRREREIGYGKAGEAIGGAK